MARFTTSGDVSAQTAVLAGGNPGSYTVATSVATGAIAASVLDLGAPYGTIFLESVGSGSVSGGAVGVDGSMDGVNFYNCIATSTVVPTSTTPTITLSSSKPARFIRLNVGTQLAGASGTLIYGGY